MCLSCRTGKYNGMSATKHQNVECGVGLSSTGRNQGMSSTFCRESFSTSESETPSTFSNEVEGDRHGSCQTSGQQKHCISYGMSVTTFLLEMCTT